MLKNSRVSKTLDTGRLGAAIARPGLDTRTWVSLAIVEEIVVDDDEGVFVNVLLVPSQQRETARLGTEYAGNGFGMYAPVMVDDEVVVEAPSGDPDQGLVVSRRLHSASDPPPSEIGENPEDVLLFVRSGKNIRVITAGGGHLVLEARGAGKVKLGSEDAIESAVRGSTYRSAEDTMLTAVSAAIALIASIPGLTPPQIAVVTAATEAITAFQLAASTYLSTKVVLP